MTPDLLTLAKTSISASTVATEDALAIFYVASARVAVARLGEELRQVEAVLLARETELARRCGRLPPKEVP
jgi:hypothetical protein